MLATTAPPTTERVQTALDQLADLQARRNARAQAYADQIAQLEQAIQTECADLDDQIDALKAIIYQDVNVLGQTVKAHSLMAVHAIRTSWNTKQLEGYAAAHPQILNFRKQKAVVSIRIVKPK